MTEPVLLSTDADGVRLLTLNRPHVANALNDELYRELTGRLRAAAADDTVSVVVLTGAGRSFCAGTDLVEMADLVAARRDAPEVPAGGTGPAGPGGGPARSGFGDFFAALVEFPKPIVAAVNGPAVGLGFTLLLHADLVFLAEDARLMAPFAAMGVAPEAASSYLLPLLVGRQRAAEILYTSDWIPAEQAVADGLALRTLPADRLLPEALASAAAIAAMPSASTVATKRLLTEPHRAAIDRARAAEDAVFLERFTSPSTEDDIRGRLRPAAGSGGVR